MRWPFMWKADQAKNRRVTNANIVQAHCVTNFTPFSRFRSKSSTKARKNSTTTTYWAEWNQYSAGKPNVAGGCPENVALEV